MELCQSGRTHPGESSSFLFFLFCRPVRELNAESSRDGCLGSGFRSECGLESGFHASVEYLIDLFLEVDDKAVIIHKSKATNKNTLQARFRSRGHRFETTLCRRRTCRLANLSNSERDRLLFPFPLSLELEECLPKGFFRMPLLRKEDKRSLRGLLSGATNDDDPEE